jgi:hypothetical protein
MRKLCSTNVCAAAPVSAANISSLPFITSHTSYLTSSLLHLQELLNLAMVRPALRTTIEITIAPPSSLYNAGGDYVLVKLWHFFAKLHGVLT